MTFQTWGPRSVIPEIRRLGCEKHDLQDSLGSIVRSYFKNRKKGSMYNSSPTLPSLGMFLLKTKQEKTLKCAGQTITV